MKAGQTSGGGNAVDSGSGVWPDPFSDTLVPGIARADYKVAVVIDNGALSNVVASSPIEIDTVIPILSSGLGSDNAGDLDWTVTSDEADGTIFAAIRLSTDPQLTGVVVKAGGGNAIATSNDPSPMADGTNGGTFPAPAADTYVVDMMHQDSYGNQSAVTSSGSVVIAEAGPTVAWVGNAAATKNVGDTATVGLSGVSTGDQLYICVTKATGSVDAATSLALETVSATLVGEEVSVASTVSIYKIACPAAAAGNAAADVVFDNTSSTGRYDVGVWKITGAITSEVSNTEVDSAGNSSPSDVSGNVGNGVALACISLRGGSVTGFTGLTEDATTTYSTFADFTFASATTTMDTPRTMQFTHDNPGDPVAGIAVALS